MEALHKLTSAGARTEHQVGASIRDLSIRRATVETFSLRNLGRSTLAQHERLTRGYRDLEENVCRFESKPINVRHFTLCAVASRRIIARHTLNIWI